MPRRRRFSDPAMQEVYDRLRASPPVTPGGLRDLGRDGHTYWIGYDRPDRQAARPGSLAYASWAAGADARRDGAPDAERPGPLPRTPKGA